MSTVRAAREAGTRGQAGAPAARAAGEEPSPHPYSHSMVAGGLEVTS